MRLPLTDGEAEQFAKQRAIAALRLLKPQPPEGLELQFIEGNDALFKGISSVHEWMWDAYVPYPSCVYDLTETWRWCGWTEIGEVKVEYKDGSTKWIGWDEEKFEDEWIAITDKLKELKFPIGEDKYYHFTEEHPNPLPWHSPVTMPAEAIRWKGIKATTTVKRVQTYLKDCIKSMIGECDNSEINDYSAMFIKDWNALHAKPVKQGDGYVCYPYDMNDPIPEDWFMASKHTYNGRRLTINPNPWLMTIELRSE